MKKLIITLLILLFTPWQSASAAVLQSQAVSLNNRTLPKNGVRIPFISLNLKALDGSITVKSLTVERSGLSSNEDFGRVWAETTNYRRTQARRLSNDDQAELEFRNGLTIAQDEVVRLYVYANLEFEGSGLTAQLNLIDLEHDGETPTQESTTETNADKIRINQRQSAYDRSRFRIKCTRGKCRLVPRD